MGEMKVMTRVRGSHVLILTFFFTVKFEISVKSEVGVTLCKRNKMSNLLTDCEVCAKLPYKRLPTSGIFRSRGHRGNDHE